MDQPLCKLTIVCPAAVEERLIELLHASEFADGGFTALAADGHGHSFAGAGPSERVRGRVRRTMIVVVLPTARAEALLAAIPARLPIEHVVYWTEPVTSFGRLELRQPVQPDENIAAAPDPSRAESDAPTNGSR